ncbi:fasciclin domain-containing protein [Citromicrobium bathyomarinum]|uniref:fasciclin domain-containing protein n=1 Tax=Citromicrobium bathyomarinum TaxID=72174 RepID=UPI00315B028A
MLLKKTHAALMLGASAAMLGGCETYGMDDGSQMASANAETTVMVGGAAMYPSRNIVENAVNSADHTTLVAAVKAAGLVDTLSGPGPFTVFAPTNDAFAKLPAGTVDTLLKPQNKQMLTDVLTYHVVPGRVSASQLMQMIRDGGGMARLETVNGGTLTARMQGGNVVLVDARGGTATVTQADVFQSNGVIHVTNAVSLPG